jgi:hypothetical protein
VFVVTDMKISKYDRKIFGKLGGYIQTYLHYEQLVNRYHKAFDPRLEFIH